MNSFCIQRLQNTERQKTKKERATERDRDRETYRDSETDRDSERPIDRQNQNSLLDHTHTHTLEVLIAAVTVNDLRIA